MRVSFAVMSLILLAGCATIVRGTEQGVTRGHDPKRGSGGVLERARPARRPAASPPNGTRNLNVNVSMDGCSPQTAFVRPRLSAGGGLLGGLPDLATGAVYDLVPSELSFTLICAATAAE